MSDTDDITDLRVLMKPGFARIKQEWHYHLANSVGRPRCGALLNLGEWQVRTVAKPPDNLCGRCARLLSPKARRIAIAPSRRNPDEDSEEQLGLPLDDEPIEEDEEMA